MTSRYSQASPEPDENDRPHAISIYINRLRLRTVTASNDHGDAIKRRTPSPNARSAWQLMPLTSRPLSLIPFNLSRWAPPSIALNPPIYVIFFPSSRRLLFVAPPACPGIGTASSSSANPRFLKSSGSIRFLAEHALSLSPREYPCLSPFPPHGSPLRATFHPAKKPLLRFLFPYEPQKPSPASKERR